MTIEQNSEIEVLPARRPPQAQALGQLMAHAEAMSAAKQLGDALAGTDMVPKDYKGKPGNAAAAILYGAELGLNPIQSLQQIFVVHGAPAIYARTAVALVKRSGIVVETVSSTNEAVTVRATDPRTGQVEESTWDIPRAELAGYTSNTKYKTDPQAMLFAKAAMEVCRKIAPDVLLGIPYSREELEMEQPPARVRSERGGLGVEGLRRALTGGDNPDVSQGAAPVPAADDAQSPAAEPEEPARAAQNRKMHALFRNAGIADRDDRLTITGHILGYRIDTSAAMTVSEASKVIDALNRWEEQGNTEEELREVLNRASLAAEEQRAQTSQA